MSLLRHHHRRIISLLSSVAAFVLALPSSNAQPQVRFRTVNSQLVIVPVYINSRGPFDFLVDTGTNTTLIDADLAAKLELKPVGRELLRSLSGSETVPRYFLRSLRVGAQSVPLLPALAQEMKELHALDSRIHGVLGLDFLLGFSFLLDYGHQQIALYGPSETPHAAAGTRVPIQIIHARILISAATEASVGGSWNLALDSGISRVAIFQNAIKYSEDSRQGSGGTIQVTTNLSSVWARVETVRDLTIADLQIHNVSVAILPNNPSLQRGIEDGLLPTQLFRWIFVNTSQRYATVELEKSYRTPTQSHRKLGSVLKP